MSIDEDRKTWESSLKYANIPPEGWELIFDSENRINKNFFNADERFNKKFTIPNWKYLILDVDIKDGSGIIVETNVKLKNVATGIIIYRAWLMPNNDKVGKAIEDTKNKIYENIAA
jgi:hypothetical protein